MRIILYILGVVITSCYYFPFELSAFTGMNSKLVLAVVSLPLISLELTKGNNIDKGLIKLTLWALALSIVALFARLINNTQDTTFVTYFVSMYVWLGGAYTVIKLLKSIYGRIDVEIVAINLAIVCVLQCVLALVFKYNNAAELWSGRVFGGEAYMGADTDDRLHGIGCALDVAGFRFAAVLIMLSFLVYIEAERSREWRVALYLGMMAIITVIGDMISRSTVIGLGLSVALFVIAAFKGNTGKILLKETILLIILTIPIVIYFYNSNDEFRDDLRFGFEGFFSLFESGRWESSSNEILKSMWVWPDNAKTWLIGDGYAANPCDTSHPSYDPYYIGPTYHGFYMGTDIGYCRFVFFFGLIGLTCIIGLITEAALICINRFPHWKLMFWMILVLNFIEWMKVSTDLFMVFAIFLCIYPEENTTYISENKSDKIV